MTLCLQQRADLTSTSHCSVCDDRLLRHLRKRQLYWFCPTCRQDIPYAKPMLACVRSPKLVGPSISINPASSKLTLLSRGQVNRDQATCSQG